MTRWLTDEALLRMRERRISRREVEAVMDTGEIIREYPDDVPYPSRLVLGWSGPRPLHVVYAVNAAQDEEIVITTYEPDPTLWEADFKTRRYR